MSFFRSFFSDLHFIIVFLAVYMSTRIHTTTHPPTLTHSAFSPFIPYFLSCSIYLYLFRYILNIFAIPHHNAYYTLTITPTPLQMVKTYKKRGTMYRNNTRVPSIHTLIYQVDTDTGTIISVLYANIPQSIRYAYPPQCVCVCVWVCVYAPKYSKTHGYHICT